MRIIRSMFGGNPDKTLSTEQERQMVPIESDGWNSYDGQNHQWYQLYYHPTLDIVRLSASGTGFFADMSEKFYYSACEFKDAFSGIGKRDWRDLLGSIDENDEAAMKFVNS